MFYKDLTVLKNFTLQILIKQPTGKLIAVGFLFLWLEVSAEWSISDLVLEAG